MREILAGRRARKQRNMANHGGMSRKELAVAIDTWNAWNQIDKKPTFLGELQC